MIRICARLFVTAFLLCFAGTAVGQQCSIGSDIDAATKSAIEQAAQQYAQDAIQGNASALQQNAVGSLATNISPVQTALANFKADLTGARASTRTIYLLNYSGQGRPEFYCGIFNSPDRTGMLINGLTPGTWAVAIEDISGGKAPITIGEILQQQGAVWKIAGFIVRDTQIGGHNSDWFLQKARDFKSRGENHNAWFYYSVAWDLAAPLPFIGTLNLDKIAQEMQSIRPTDLPTQQNPLSLTAGSKTFQVTSIDAIPVGDVLDLRIRYKAQAPNSDTSQLYQDNNAVMKAVVDKYPEYRDGFPAVIARALDPNGVGDYGSVVEMSKLASTASPATPHPQN
jgi:hypothetical protein